MKTKGILFTVLSALLFGVTPVLASRTYELGSTPETLTFYRNLLVIPLAAVLLSVKRVRLRLPARVIGFMVLFGVLGRGVTTLMLYSSYRYVGIGTATTLHFLYPVFVALICRFFYKEHLGRVRLAALVAASLGIVFFLDRGESAAAAGVALAAVSGLTYAFYMVGMDKKGLKDIDPYLVSFYMALAVSGAMLVYNLPTGRIVFALPPRAFAYTLVISLCTSFLAVILLQLGIKELSAVTAAIFCLVEPVAGSICGRLFLGEPFGLGKIAGSALILVGAGILMAGGEKAGVSGKRAGLNGERAGLNGEWSGLNGERAEVSGGENGAGGERTQMGAPEAETVGEHA